MNALTVISTDLLTPLGAYLRLRESGRASFLLESVEKGRLGRHSFVGSGSRIVDVEEAETCGLPVVGYLGYDHAARLEPTVQLPDDGRDLPESRFVVAEMLVRFDHGLGMAEVLCGDPAAVAELLEGPQPSAAPGARSRAGSTRRLPSRHEYERAVVRAKEHIRAGDAFQIVLSQRAERPTSASALELYRSLRRVNPSPYLFLLELDGLALVGSSPETLVKAEGRHASLNPIAGTTRPGEGDAERLLGSEKERAEHVMLVDLGRNDLSRVCLPGTVRLARFLEPERFSHVTHLVSEVVGELGPDVSHFDLLRACFPAGTVSGAPKVRAMQLISELERYRRGPYAGAVLYALPGEALDACIAIRTVVLHDGVALLQAGAGIVADSDPAAEHDECLRKLAALEMAIELAEARGTSPSSGAAGGAGPEGTVLRRTGPESTVPPAASGGGGAGLRPAGGDAGEGGGTSPSSGAAGGAGPEGTVLRRTGPESTVPPAASGGGGAGLRPAGGDAGEGGEG